MKVIREYNTLDAVVAIGNNGGQPIPVVVWNKDDDEEVKETLLTKITLLHSNQPFVTTDGCYSYCGKWMEEKSE